MTRFTSFFARKRINKLTVLFLVAGTSFLFSPQAHANSGLQATFWNNQTQDNQFNDAPPIPPTTDIVASIPVATVDQDFDLNPVAGMIDDFIVKYEGYITATESGTANLQCLADDGCIVIIDGATIINEWYDKGTSGDVYQYQLVPNQSLPFTVWYYENGGGAVVQLRWQIADRDWAVVPESVFSTMPMAAPIVESPSETHTVVSPETDTVVSDSQTAVSDTQTSLDTPESPTAIAVPDETQTSTSESNTQTIPSETSTPIVEIPLPTPPPVVEPQPVPIPVPVVVEPQPIPQPEPEPEPLPEEIDEEVPLEEPPLEEQPTVEEPVIDEEPSEPQVEEETNETPVEEPEILEPLEPTPEPLPQPVVEPAPVTQPETAYIPPSNSEPMVTLDNGVVITEEEAAAIVLLSDPAELISELFSDPGAVLSALGSVGADMSPEVREKSEKIVLSAVIAGNIATQAAATAGAVAAYRRKP